MGLPFSGERLDAGLAVPPHAEKGCEVMKSGPSLFDLGYLEREEHGRVRRRNLFQDQIEVMLFIFFLFLG